MSTGRSYDFVRSHVKTFWPNFLVPLFAALLPNRTLLCTVSSSLLFTKTEVYSLPKRILESDVSSSCKGPSLILGTDRQTSDHTSVGLCKAILGRTFFFEQASLTFHTIYIMELVPVATLDTEIPDWVYDHPNLHALPCQRYCHPGKYTLCSADYPLHLSATDSP